jgi:ribosome maturation factor RimP
VAVVTDRVARVVEPAVTASGLVLEGVEVARAGARSVVRVVVDLPDDAVGSVGSDQLAAVSRAVGAALDEDDSALGSAPYVLEVGSPGVSRPLTQRRHWARARTRLVTVPVDGEPVTGRVVAVGDAGVELEAATGRVEVPWAQLGTGRVEVEFRRPGADGAGAGTEDDDALGAPDEQDEEG